MMLVLRGGCDEILLDGQQSMTINNVVLIPGNMVHGANIGDLGCDAIDIFAYKQVEERWCCQSKYSETSGSGQKDAAAGALSTGFECGG